MRHKFLRAEIPEGQDRIIESCLNGCGTRVERNRRGSIMYLNSNGKKDNRVPSCLAGDSYRRSRFTSDMVNTEQGITIKPKITMVSQGLTSDEAILKDALSIILMMYEDMMKYKILTNSTRIASTFLDSHRFKEIKKKIESKLT